MSRTVAVCVCTRNRPEQLERLLGRLASADLGAAGGLIVVDNAPGGSVHAICTRLAPSLPVPTLLVEEPEPGIASARNRALAAALDEGAEAVAFIDDDDLPEPDWLAELVAVRAASDADLVFGAARPPAGVKVPGYLRRVRPLATTRLGRLNRYHLPGSAGTHNVLLSRRLIERLAAEGPVFRPDLGRTGGSDTELFVRAARKGLAWAPAPGSIVETGHDPSRVSLRGVLRRSYRHGCTQVLVDRLHRPAEATRRQIPATLWQLLRAILALPLHVVPPSRLVAQLCKIARAAGKLQGLLGRPYSYYS